MINAYAAAAKATFGSIRPSYSARPKIAPSIPASASRNAVISSTPATTPEAYTG